MTPTPFFPARLPGLSLTVGEFLPRLRLPTVAGSLLTPADLVDEQALAVCIYNPAPVNPFPLPPRGVDLPRRLAMLAERGVLLYVISGLGPARLVQWMDQIGFDFYALSDENRAFAAQVGIPIKRVDGQNFRTHCAFVLQEDRILAILPETDPIHDFPALLTALDIAAGGEPQVYALPDQPWYVQRQAEQLQVEAEEEEELPDDAASFDIEVALDDMDDIEGLDGGQFDESTESY